MQPGLALSLPRDRQPSICLLRLASGHLNCLTYSEGNKIYSLCPKCQQHQASPKHFLESLGLDWEEIYSSPLLVIDFIKVNSLDSLIWSGFVRLDWRLVTTTTRKFSVCKKNSWAKEMCFCDLISKIFDYR
ncbi:hypothetical protein AVEN_113928-1 [Araneus ventricosus]|uniref:Uncharacterized protein n=1 Tax=Araneus ventricosus TaxID=182803 RepID=A0A4Y2S8A3_ARAVE|nr:hypothetical protein AVEN_144557-1 [Araneus ventricosus]GBN84113.1 hypothetical protein AVEN_113928-1 [Araneus ventricosus]